MSLGVFERGVVHHIWKFHYITCRTVDSNKSHASKEHLCSKLESDYEGGFSAIIVYLK